jgi:hypothetical protein
MHPQRNGGNSANGRGRVKEETKDEAARVEAKEFAPARHHDDGERRRASDHASVHPSEQATEEKPGHAADRRQEHDVK